MNLCISDTCSVETSFLKNTWKTDTQEVTMAVSAKWCIKDILSDFIKLLMNPCSDDMCSSDWKASVCSICLFSPVAFTPLTWKWIQTLLNPGKVVFYIILSEINWSKLSWITSWQVVSLYDKQTYNYALAANMTGILLDCARWVEFMHNSGSDKWMCVLKEMLWKTHIIAVLWIASTSKTCFSER